MVYLDPDKRNIKVQRSEEHGLQAKAAYVKPGRVSMQNEKKKKNQKGV
jgi:hypothetical protein